MRAIIEDTLYDTETAEEVTPINCQKILYKTKNGNFFTADALWGIKPIESFGAKELCRTLPPEDYKRVFGTKVEEA